MSDSGSLPRRKPRFRERHVLRTVEAPPTATTEKPPPPPVTVASRPPSRRRALRVPTVTREQGLYAVITAMAFALRIWDVGSRAMHGDEAVHAWFAWNLFNGTGYQYDPVYHGPLQFPLTALFFFLFGVSNTTGRLLSVLCGTGLVAMPYFLRREMGRAAALLAAVLLATSPAFLYVSRLERDDMIISLLTMIMAVSLFRFVRTRQLRYVYLGAAAITLSLSTMENTYITLFVFGTFLIIVFASEFLARLPGAGHVRSLAERSGDLHRLAFPLWLGAVVALLLAFALTVATGAYLPVPLILGGVLVALVARQAALETYADARPAFTSALRSIPGSTWINAVTIIIAILFLFYSTFGTNLRGIWDASQPFFNTHGACTSNSFFLNPCRKDIIGGLFYWLSQHQVHRGGQPWFYYTFLFGLYQQIAVIFGVGGMLWFLRRPTMFTSFLTYWAVLTFGIYSWAGEKFPWLMVHPLLPFTLIAAMFIVEVARLASRARYVVLAFAVLLLGVQLHSAFEVNYVYGADPVEMMVYVQSSPDTPKVASDILNLSNKVTNGNTMHVTIDSPETWPFAWYLRDMPNVAYPSSSQLKQKAFASNPVILVDALDEPSLAPKLVSYSGHLYTLRWWFPEDYKTLTWPSFFHDAVDPGHLKVIGQWLFERRQFGPKGNVQFYYYVKKGLASPF